MTGQRKGYFDNIEITEPLTMDVLNVNDITINDNASGLSLHFNSGSFTNLNSVISYLNNLSGINISYDNMNNTNFTNINSSITNISGSNCSYINMNNTNFTNINSSVTNLSGYNISYNNSSFITTNISSLTISNKLTLAIRM